jgi:hypothetical protein
MFFPFAEFSIPGLRFLFDTVVYFILNQFYFSNLHVYSTDLKINLFLNSAYNI